MLKTVMPKFFVLVLLLAACLSASAQTVLTVSNAVPKLGDVFTLKNVDSISLVQYVDPVAAAGNQTWNYAGWTTENDAFTVSYLAPAATPFDSVFAAADVAAFNNSDSAYTYYSLLNNNALYKVGTGSGFLGASKYSDPQQVFSFPFGLNSPILTDSFHFKLELSFFMLTVIAAGQDSIVPLAKGALILPNGVTLNNVLCIKRITHERDNAGAFSITNNDATSYEFYNGANRYPVLTVTRGVDAFTQTPTISASILQDPITTGTEQALLSARTISVFPNPVDAQLHIQGDTYSLLNIINAQGVSVYAGTQHNPMIDTGNWPNGVYFIRTDGQAAGKIIVQH